jgi:pyruvate ferredoxin oxidoreductase alpha subunit
MRKMAKAQWYARNEGLVYGKVLSFCPLNWRTKDDAAQEVLQTAIDCCFFPLYEVERGSTKLTYEPDAIGRRRQVADWLRMMGKSRHLLKPENADLLQAIEQVVDTRWRKLKIKHATPEL